MVVPLNLAHQSLASHQAFLQTPYTLCACVEQPYPAALKVCYTDSVMGELACHAEAYMCTPDRCAKRPILLPRTSFSQHSQLRVHSIFAEKVRQLILLTICLFVSWILSEWHTSLLQSAFDIHYIRPAFAPAGFYNGGLLHAIELLVQTSAHHRPCTAFKLKCQSSEPARLCSTAAGASGDSKTSLASVRGSAVCLGKAVYLLAAGTYTGYCLKSIRTIIHYAC